MRVIAKRTGLLAGILLACASVGPAQQQSYLYKATLLQAAPGKLLDVIEIYKGIFADQAKIGSEQSPFWMRHSQGDRWDLLLLLPIGNYSEYYVSERVARRDKALGQWHEKLKQDIAWQEDMFVYGPPLDEVRKAFSGAGFFHVEMFQALPGKLTELYTEREMENAFARALSQPENLIFVRDQGAAWDLFTIGCFRNLKHFADSEDAPEKNQEDAAKAAGFESASQIGPSLRKWIALHHDTLAVAVK